MLVNMSMVVPYKPSSSLTITEAPFRVAIDLACTCTVTITYMIVKRTLRPLEEESDSEAKMAGWKQQSGDARHDQRTERPPSRVGWCRGVFPNMFMMIDHD